jgi:hypothetical protein
MISDLEGLGHGCRDANKTLAGLRKECADLKVLALKASLTYVFFSKYQCYGSTRPPGSGSISQRYGTGAFYHQAKIVRKTWILLFCDFFWTFYL